ncbi:MAG: alpha/beta hydrolase [Cyclobacteriaceae bacterium]
MFQEKFIFQPKKLAKEYPFQFDQPFTEYFIKTEDGETLNALLFKSPTPSKGFILYFHGNAGSLQRWGQYAIDFTQLGYDILMIDYRGYGKSTGTPSEKDLYRDAQTVLNWSREKIPFTQLIIYGRSLGSAVASHLASENTPDMLILETPFDEIKSVVYPPIRPIISLFPTRNYFPNNHHLQKVKCRKVIFHGTNDWIVPFSSALKLKPLLDSEDRFFVIEGGGHRNLRDFKEYHKALAESLGW